MRRLPPLNSLRAFEAAARREGFVAAAAELNVTPAAISQQVKALEAYLGVTLFERRPRSLVLTERGRFYLPALSRALDEMAAATAALMAPRRAISLTLAAPTAFAAGWLLPRLPGFRDRHPEIDL